MPAPRNIRNQKFGKLTAIEPTSQRKIGAIVWRCVCDCGNEKLTTAQNLLRGDAKSCGCATLEMISKASRKHGRPDGYDSWANMKQRCDNPKAEGYSNYGGRGIKVCDRWKEFDSFLFDMGPRPSKQHSLERLDNSSNYEPSNCVWATRKEQSENMRTTRRVTAFGKTQSIGKWAKEYGISWHVLNRRLSVMISPEAALIKPRKKGQDLRR